MEQVPTRLMLRSLAHCLGCDQSHDVDHDSDKSDNKDSFISFFAFLTLILITACACFCCVWRCLCSCHEMYLSDRLDEEAAAAWMRDFRRTVAHADPKDRREFVASALKTKEFSISDTAISADSTDGQEGDHAQQCAICLESFVEGEKISSSHNLDCNHEFHEECIFLWLLSQGQCPCCRRNYLSAEKDIEVASNSQPALRRSHSAPSPSLHAEF